MNLLLFFVSSLFSAIFYIFYLTQTNKSFLGYSLNSNIVFDTFGDLYLESILFFIIGVFFLFFFSNFGLKARKKKNLIDEEFNIEDEDTIKNPLFTKQELFSFLKDIFKKYNYYFAFILAYLSIFFIFKSFDFISINIFILIVNLIVFSLFFINNKFFIFRDFIKINTIIFSIYYIFFLFLPNFFLKDFSFQFIVFLDTFFIFLSFIINLYLDTKILKTKSQDKTLLYYFSIYSFLFISYYINILFNDLIFTLILIGFFISVLSLFYFGKNIYFKENIINFRIISFSFLYLSSFLSIIYFIQNGFNFIVFPVLLYSIIVNFLIHKQFENYISFFFTIFITIFLFYFFYFEYFKYNDDGFLFLVLSLGISIEMVILTYFYKLPYLYDNHFLHFISYINSFFAVSYFLIVFGFDFFTLGIILLIVSIYIFSSFNKLRNIS